MRPSSEVSGVRCGRAHKHALTLPPPRRSPVGSFDPSLVDDVIFGCVSQVGAQGANIGRNVVLNSSVLPLSVPGTAVDRQCGSSQQAIHFAAQAVMSGVQDVVIAAGKYILR